MCGQEKFIWEKYLKSYYDENSVEWIFKEYKQDGLKY